MKGLVFVVPTRAPQRALTVGGDAVILRLKASGLHEDALGTLNFHLKSSILEKTHSRWWDFMAEGTHVLYCRLIHIDVWHRPSQYCKVIVLKLR